MARDLATPPSEPMPETAALGLVSVVIPAWNEEEPIGHTVKDFQTPEVDEVLVIDNNSTDNTAKVAKSAGATVVPEPIQGYGVVSP